MGGLIEFQTGQIADIGSQTLNQKSQWDAIWESGREQGEELSSQLQERASSELPSTQ